MLWVRQFKPSHPLRLQRSQPPSARLRLLESRMPSSPLTCRVSFEKINKARIVKEGGGITFFAKGLESELVGHRSMVLWGKCTFSRVSNHIFRKNKMKTSHCNKGDTSRSIGTMCKICSKAKWQCCKNCNVQVWGLGGGGVGACTGLSWDSGADPFLQHVVCTRH